MLLVGTDKAGERELTNKNNSLQLVLVSFDVLFECVKHYFRACKELR